MTTPHSSAELHTLMEQVADLVLRQGHEWSEHVLRRAWIDHNLSTVTARCDAPFHDLIVEDFAYEPWSSGQLFKLVRDALRRAGIDFEQLDWIRVTLDTDIERAAWRRAANGEWLTQLEVGATLRLRNGTEIHQQQVRDRLVPNVMLLAEGLEAQPHDERKRTPPHEQH